MPNATKGPSSSHPEESNRPQPLAGCLLQLASGIGGFTLIVILCVMIARESPWTLGWKDLVFWAAALGMIVARRIEIARYPAQVAENLADAPRQFRLYALILLPVSGLAWATAQSFRI